MNREQRAKPINEKVEKVLSGGVGGSCSDFIWHCPVSPGVLNE